MEEYQEWLEGLPQKPKPWRLSKPQIIQHWASLPNNIPFATVRSIPKDHHGSTHPYDGLRIEGSTQFIDAIISRIKDLLQHEGGDTRLQIVYRQQVDPNTEQPIPESYVFYVQVKQRNPPPTLQ